MPKPRTKEAAPRKGGTHVLTQEEMDQKKKTEKEKPHASTRGDKKGGKKNAD